MPRPRILHVASLLDPYGASRQLRLLIDGLQDNGWENRVIALRCVGDAHREIEAAGVPVVRLQQRWKADPIALGRLACAILAACGQRGRADLIHCWDLPALAYTCAVQSVRSKRPLLATISSLRLDVYPLRLALRLLAHRTVRLVTSNTATRQLCASTGVDQKKLVVIPPAASQRDARGPAYTVATRLARRNALLEELSLPRETRLIAVVGPLLALKRVDDAIWCFELVRVLHENARLLVIGDGPERRRLERFARLVCEPGTVRFLGLRKDMTDILPLVDVLWQRSDSCVATEHTESPNAVLEAMAAGVPIVATDIGPHRQYIEHGETGFLSPVGGRADCTRFTDQLLSDAELAQRIGLASQQYAREQFSIERVIQEYEQLYRHLLSSET